MNARAPPAAVLAIRYQASEPRPRLLENLLRPLHEGGAVPLLVLVRRRQHARQRENPLMVH